MRKHYFLTIMLLLLAGTSFSQGIKTTTFYYNENGDTVTAKNAVKKVIKKSAVDGSYTLNKYDLKGKRQDALEVYGTDGLPIGTWKVYDVTRKQLRTLNFDDAIKFQALSKKEELEMSREPTIDIAAPPSAEENATKRQPLSEPVLKPGKYKNFREYFNQEFYLNEAINDYLINEEQLGSVRILLTINPLGKVTHITFRPSPGPQLARELTRVFLNSPELVFPGQTRKPPVSNAIFSLHLQVE